MEVITYLTFDGTCQAALDFYVEKLGGEITMTSPYSDLPSDGEMSVGPEHADRVLHARIKIGATHIYASDCFPGQTVQHGGFSLALTTGSIEAATDAFAALSDGGVVTMPAGPTFWSPYFGSCTDKYGVSWMVDVEAE